MSDKELRQYEARKGDVLRTGKSPLMFDDAMLKALYHFTENDLKRWHEEYPKDNIDDEANKVKAFLREERQKYESLGCGFNKGVYYFGTKVFKDGQGFNAVVTSDKKFYASATNSDFLSMGGLQKAVIKAIDKQNAFASNDIMSKFGLNYKDDFFDESLDNIFSAKAIKQWLFEDCDEITLKSVFDKFIEVLKKYIYLDDERKYQLLACYRIASFFMPIWKARARLFLFAEMGSAKSRLTQIMHNTGFNSVALGDWTLAYLKTIIESTRGETHIDDFETLPEEQKNASIRLVKVGYMRGFKAGKMSDGNKRKPEVNDLFNTTTLNNTEGLDFISYDRCVTIRIPKISKKEYDKEPNFEEGFWQELRDELYILGLKYPEAVKETYEEIKSDKIRGRLFSIIKPELTIARLISDKVYSDIEDFWVQETEQRQNIDYETDWEFLAYKKIYELNTESFFELKEEVVEPLGKELYSNEEEWKKKKRGFSTTIGRVFAREPRFQKRVVTGKTQYKISRENLISLLEAKSFLKPIKDILGETGSTSPTLSTSSISSTSPTHHENQVELVEHIERGGSKTSQPYLKNFSELPVFDINPNSAKVMGVCNTCDRFKSNCQMIKGKLYCLECLTT